jgi:hypothetical protein
VQQLDLGPGEALLHEGDPARCAVLLPGVAYFSQAPLLWFAREAVQAHGWSVLELTERAPAREDPVAWMRDRARRALEAAGESATSVAVIGKSLASTTADLAAGRPAVWLTPLLSRPEVVDAVEASDAPALLVGSPADPTWGDGEVPHRDGLEVLELDGLDHSLQVEGDPAASLDVLARVTSHVGDFIARLDD